jgi:hypothetical protein
VSDPVHAWNDSGSTTVAKMKCELQNTSTTKTGYLHNRVNYASVLPQRGQVEQGSARPCWSARVLRTNFGTWTNGRMRRILGFLHATWHVQLTFRQFPSHCPARGRMHFLNKQRSKSSDTGKKENRSYSSLTRKNSLPSWGLCWIQKL